jgi:hypothetical protein
MMSGTMSSDPTRRQVLVNLGNRFVVFGPEGGLPETIQFSPNDSPILPRVADESEGTESRIVETLQVSGLKRAEPSPASGRGADIELQDQDGNRILIEVKVREGDPRRRDLDAANALLRRASERGERLEVWFFNIERLKLTVMRYDNGSRLQFDYLAPLNVWEKTPEETFERGRVVEEVEDWLNRVDAFYKNVQIWLAEKPDLHFEQTRTVVMSEELMQKFAVVDRELRILDVLRDDEVIVSFVPRGLWLIGSWGRIDMITTDKTIIILAIKQNDYCEWRFASFENRRQLKILDKSALLELLGNQ